MAAVSTYRIIIEKQAVLMSGIFGFINLDGRPANPEEFQKMAGEMGHWGPDGVGSMIQGSAAMGYAHLIVTHESPYEKMPYHDTETDVLFTAAARLDNRDELCDLFGIPHPQRPTTPDGRLVWLAWRKWGTDSCRHVFGDWSFAAWDKKEKKLFLARDHMGNTGIYFYYKPPLIIFASDTAAIFRHSEAYRRINEKHLAQRLIFDYSEEIYFNTYWIDVYFLPAFHVITFTDAGKQMRRYWHFENVPKIFFKSDNEYLECFLDHFRRAVRVRLNSIRPVASTLSAGLDSSAVTALAAQELKKRNQPLVAYTSVPLYSSDHLFPGRMTNEWPLAHKVANLYDNIEHVPINAEDITPLMAIKQSLKITHVPQHAGVNMVWIVSMFENARSRNIGLMLTGQLGNGIVSWSGGRDYILHLLASKKWINVWKTLVYRKAWHKNSWYRVVKNQLLRPILMPLMFKYKVLHDQIKQRTIKYSFPREDFIKLMGLEDVHDNILAKYIAPSEERKLIIEVNGMKTGAVWSPIGSFYNMDVRDPTSDMRLLEFCLRVPDEHYTFRGGERMLIRRAMDGILPDVVRWSNVRGKQSADAIPRLVDFQDEVESEIKYFMGDNLLSQYLDIASMENTWMKMASGVLPATAAGPLLRAFGNAYFLLSERQ
jgi:asparagine synthase (glutamine-hydrolysing)